MKRVKNPDAFASNSKLKMYVELRTRGRIASRFQQGGRSPADVKNPDRYRGFQRSFWTEFPRPAFTRRVQPWAFGLQTHRPQPADAARLASDHLAAPPPLQVFRILSLGSGGRGTKRLAKVNQSALVLTGSGRWRLTGNDPFASFAYLPQSRRSSHFPVY